MNTTTIDHSPLMSLAAEHLVAAASHAKANACGDPTSAWHSLAGQIRLVAGSVSPVCDDGPVTPRPFGVQDHLDAALTALDSIPPGFGPPDLVVWAWRVAGLRSLVPAWPASHDHDHTSRPPSPGQTTCATSYATAHTRYRQTSGSPSTPRHTS